MPFDAMSDTDFLRILAVFLLGSATTAVGAWLNHLLTLRRLDRQERSSEVSFWRSLADDLWHIHMDIAESQSLTTVDTLPSNLNQVQDGEIENLDRLRGRLIDLQTRIRRAPEPLTDHVRLLNARLDAAHNARPVDSYLARRAIVDFRAALDEYRRRARTRPPRLHANEKPPPDNI